MPRYRISTEYSSPAALTSEQQRTVGGAVEAAAVAQLRLATGEGRVPATVADALTLIQSWYAAERLSLPVIVAAGIPRDAIGFMSPEGEPLGIITNVGD